MPFKRPHSPRSVSSDAGSSDSDRVQGPSKRVHQSSPPSARQSPVIDHPLRVHILPVKLQSGVLEGLINLVEKSSSGGVGGQELQLTADVEQADVIVTTVHMRPRLERHIDWELAVCLSHYLLPTLAINFVHRKPRPSLHPTGLDTPSVPALCFHVAHTPQLTTSVTILKGDVLKSSQIFLSIRKLRRMPAESLKVRLIKEPV
jgi:hypothetical protein